MKEWQIDIKVKGLTDIMFDRFYDQSKTKRPPEAKMYINDGIISFPSMNIRAFLTSQRNGGCVRVFEGKNWADYYRVCQSFVRIEDCLIPFLDENEQPIKFDDFKEKTFIYTCNVLVGHGQNVSRQTISRPVLKLPWFLEFQIILFENELIKLEKLKEYFQRGGKLIGFGNGRPQVGQFEIIKWDVRELQS